MAEQRMKVRDKKVQKMTKDGLVEENLTDKSSVRVSNRVGDVQMGRKQGEKEENLVDKSPRQSERSGKNIRPSVQKSRDAPELIRTEKQSEDLGQSSKQQNRKRIRAEVGKESRLAEKSEAGQSGRLKEKRADLSENRGDSRRNQTGGSKKPKQKQRLKFAYEETGASVKNDKDMEKLNQMDTDGVNFRHQKQKEKAKKFSYEEARKKKEAKQHSKKAQVYQANEGEGSGKKKSRLKFGEGESVKTEKAFVVKKAGSATSAALHREISKNEDDNAAVEGAYKLEEGCEGIYRLEQRSARRRKQRASRKRSRLERQAEKQTQAAARQEQKKLKKQIQKQQIKRDYAKAKRSEQTVGTATKGTIDYIKKIGGKVTNFFKENRKVYISVAVLIGLMFLIITNVTSCSAVFLQNVITYTGTSYLSSDQAIREAELYYTQLEANLQERINNMESEEPGHEEYRYNIGPIEHDPFILISYLSAKYEEFTFEQVKPELDALFTEQYHLTTEAVNETVTETATVRVGESLGQVVTSGYCNCPICCGIWSGGPTASGAYPTANHTFYLKEITAPQGYVVNATATNVKLVASKTSSVTVENKEQLAELTIYKEGQVLTGADVSENGTVFQYENRRQKNAVYNVYAGADIVTAYGTKVYSKGDLVKENLTTGENGSVTLKNLHLGNYVVKEEKAPDNFYNGSEEKSVTLTYAGQNKEVVFADVTFNNERQKADVSVVKQDKDTKKPLKGGIFALYASDDIRNADGTVVVKKGTLIEKATTGADGTAKFTADLPIGYSYSVKEDQAPEGYVRNTEDVYTFKFSYTNDKEATVSFAHTFSNDRVTAKINLYKVDKETGKAVPQGDATLKSAVYGLYAREDIVHPDGATGTIYKAGEQVASLTTDDKGQASVNGLYLGKYYIKEITPPTGYLADTEEHDLTCSYEGDMTAEVKRECTSSEQVIKQPFQIIKAANNGKTDADLLSGAGFTVYLKSSLTKKADGSYDFDSAKPVVSGENGATEIFTDEKGYACSIPLSFGSYIVRETTTPHNYKPVDDFEVNITEHHPNEPQIWRVLLDEEFKAKLKIVKKDDETKKSVLIAGTEFKVYDLDNKKYVEQVTTYPVTTTHKSYFTDSQGYLIMPKNLKIGHYRIEEVNAPEGYTINKNYVEIAVDANTAYQMDSESGDAIITVDYENHPVKGKLTIYKKGEMLTGFKKDFVYEERYLKGAEFNVYAAENIYTPDYQKDENRNRQLIYAKDALVTTVTTGEDGKAVADNLPLGSYYVVEETAPEGFVLNHDRSEVAFVYANQDTPVIEQEVTVGDDRQKVAIQVEKQDAENGATVAGAVFGIYNKADIKADGKVIVKVDTLLQEMTSDNNGLAVCTLDLPLGQYYVKELKAPAGFVSSDEVLNLNASYQGQDVKTVKLKTVKKNQPTTVEITKSDVTTGVELDGAKLTVLDKEGNVVDQWTSVKDQPHVIKRLTVGEEYTLREEMAPYGYLKAMDVKFTLEDTEEIQKVEMKDEVPTGLLIINKNGEFLDKVTLLDNVKGTVEHLFEYVTGSLTDVTFDVFAAEDIKAADGVSEDYFKADEKVGTITTDSNGIAQMGDLPAGKYYVKEVKTAHGYVLDKEPRYVDLSYRDQDTPVITYDEKWQNARQKVKVTVLKKEKDTERVLAGGVFGLYTSEDIKNAKGEVLLEKESLIEQRVTDEKGQITFTADLPIDGKYYVKEIFAPDGFVTTDEVQEFTFEYAGEDQAEVSYDFTFENQPTTVELSKTDLTTGKELPGAHLKVTDSDGNTVDEWTSTEESHVIKELVVGKKYTMTETKPADGYVTAESITFTVENTAEVQKHDMKDDVTKVEISKTDITGETEIPGAKLTILDKDDQVVESWTSTEEAHYIEKLPIGKYTLREEQAPKGYLLTADVTFEVKDTGEIQKVAMKDDTAKGKVILNKTDKSSGEPLKGVEFELRDSKGKVLETLKTDAAGHAESKLYEIATFKNGKYDAAIKYYLVETKTLDGYTLDQSKHEVTFAYADDSTPVVEVTFNLTNEKPEVPETPNTPDTPQSHEETKISNAPKTGDSTNIWLPILLLVTSTGGMAGLYISRKRKSK